MILRKNSEMLVTILQVMLCTGIPELTKNSISIILLIRIFGVLFSARNE